MGNKNKYFLWSILTEALAFNYNKEKNSNIKGIHLNPKWSKSPNVVSYQTIMLEGYINIVELENNCYLVLYGNGCNFKNKSGDSFRTFPLIEKEIKSTMLNIKIEKI